MELFDVVDCNRKSLNYTKQRGCELLENEYNEGIEVWIINDNKILITKRSMEKSHPGEWEVPGGCCQAGEKIIDTVIREMNEEIGTCITDKDVKLIDTKLYKKQFVDIFESNVKIDIKNVKLQKEEVSDVKFVSKKEFEEMNSNGKIVKSVYERYKLIKDKLNLK